MKAPVEIEELKNAIRLAGEKHLKKRYSQTTLQSKKHSINTFFSFQING